MVPLVSTGRAPSLPMDPYHLLSNPKPFVGSNMPLSRVKASSTGSKQANLLDPTEVIGQGSKVIGQASIAVWHGSLVY